jgi:hypothetical protein
MIHEAGSALEFFRKVFSSETPIASINNLTNKSSQTPINLPWRDEVDIINSCNKGMSTLVGTVNVSTNLNNVNIKDCEQRKHERATLIIKTNLRRTSARQIKIPATRREDFFYGKSLI